MRSASLLASIAICACAPSPGGDTRLAAVPGAALLLQGSQHAPQVLLRVPITSPNLDHVEALHRDDDDGPVVAAVVHHGRRGGATLYLRRAGAPPAVLWTTAPTEDLGSPRFSPDGAQLAVRLSAPVPLEEARSAGREPPGPYLLFDVTEAAPRPTRRTTLDWEEPSGDEAPRLSLAVRVPERMAWRAHSAFAMPYIHQVYDTPDSFNGHWACGPTSTLMAMQHFGRLPKKTITVQSNGAHPSDYGAYISQQYTAFGHTFSRSQGDASGKPAQGAYGHCTENGAAWAWRMQDYAKKHDLKSDFAGSSSFSVIEGHLAAGKVVVLSTRLTSAGHIITVKGTTADGKLIVNDPYGDRNQPKYPNPQGEGAIYTWAQVKAKWHITVHGVPTTPPAPPYKATVLGINAPAALEAGQRSEATVMLRNDGSQAWDSATRLGTTMPQDRQSAFHHSSWIAPHRPVATGAVAPGETVTLRFAIQAPEGHCEELTFEERFNLLAEGKAWFSAQGQGGPGDDAITLAMRVAADPTAPGCGPDAGLPSDGNVPVADASPPAPDGAVLSLDAGIPPTAASGAALRGGCAVHGENPGFWGLCLLLFALLRRRRG